MQNDPANLGRMAELPPAVTGTRARLNLSLTPPRRPLRLRRWAYVALAALGVILALHLAAKGMPKTAFDAVMYEGAR